MSDSNDKQQGGYVDDTISLTEWISILLDDWKTFVIPWIVIVIAVAGYLITIVPSYQAEGIIQVTTENESPAVGALVEMSGMTATSAAETEVEILGSRRILIAAAHQLKLNLSKAIPKVTRNLNVSLFGHSPTNKQLMLLRRSISDFSIADWNESPVKGYFSQNKNGDLVVKMFNKTTVVSKGEMFSLHGVRFTFNGTKDGQAIQNLSVDIIPDDRLVRDLKNNLSIKTIGDRKATNLVKISFTAKDRHIASNFINAIMNAYMTFALDWRTTRADKRAVFIEKQIDTVRRSLEKTEQALQQFLESNGAILLPEQARTLIEESSNLHVDMEKLKIQDDIMKKMSFQIHSFAGSGKDVGITGDFVADDPVLGQDVAQLHQLQLKRETLLADYTPAHPQIIKLSKEISRVRNQINQYITASRKRLIQHQKGIDDALGRIQNQLAAFPQKERAIATLRRNQDVDQRMYVFLMTKLEESRIVRASTTTDKRIIDKALTPYEKSTPKRLNIFIAASFGGLLFGFVIVYLKRLLDPRVQDEEEAKSLTGLPVHGVIPDMSILGFNSSSKPITQQIWEFPKGPAAEAFRTLKTNVEFSKTREQKIQVIQITSSEASEGKSTVISNLAVALSKAGNRVLLADLDLRKPTQHRIWSIPRSPGMSDYLSGREKLYSHLDSRHGVTLVAAGYDPPESQRLLASESLTEQVEAWRKEYDYVLLDTSPLLIADSLVVSKICDMMLFVVRPHQCKRSGLKLAINSYSKVDTVKGLIINGSVTRKGGYYHYYRGSYYGATTSDTQETP